MMSPVWYSVWDSMTWLFSMVDFSDIFYGCYFDIGLRLRKSL